ncbi:MAG: electron transfer flavoprotein subunit alpha/FixB family protein, partial [Microbacterium sp.]|nr:electron transfer flavoprotein subunit alpha/FixB family protein [Microbacterium sp.]
MVDFAADSILVVLDVTPGGDLASSAAGLLGAAAGVGTPVALIVAADAALQALAQDAADLGAAVVLTATGDAERLTVPTVDALAAAAARVAPDAVVLSHSVDGRDVAGRFAARTRSALAGDAVGLARDEEGVVAHHSVYGGA